jgi:hypothetical protein
MYDFSYSDAQGSFSSSMQFQGFGSNTLTIAIDNKSAQQAYDPGITGFGFDLAPISTNFSITSWILKAFDKSNQEVTIGSSSPGAWTWGFASSASGVTLDYLNTTLNGSKGALYAPYADGSFGGPPQYFTKATLTVSFNSIVQDIVTASPGTAGADGSPYIRVQNYGKGGNGSLKLYGTPNGTPLPEPASIATLGLSVIMLAGVMRLRRRTV